MRHRIHFLTQMDLHIYPKAGPLLHRHGHTAGPPQDDTSKTIGVAAQEAAAVQAVLAEAVWDLFVAAGQFLLPVLAR